MAFKRIVPLPSFSGIAAGNTATVDVPIGNRYHSIWLAVNNANNDALATIVSEIRVKVNGKVQRVMTPAELDAINKANGDIYAAITTANVKRIPIYFAEPWRKRVDVQNAFSWATGGLSTFQVEVVFAASAYAPTVTAFAELQNSILNKDSRPQEMGAIVKWFNTQIPVTGTQVFVQTLPKRDFYQSIHFFDSYISKVTLKADGFVLREITKTENDNILTQREMKPVAGRFDLVFDYDDDVDSALDVRGVSDFQIVLDLSDGTARNIKTVYQTFGAAD